MLRLVVQDRAKVNVNSQGSGEVQCAIQLLLQDQGSLQADKLAKQT